MSARGGRDRALVVVGVLAVALVGVAIYVLTIVLDDSVYSHGPSMNPTMRDVDRIEIDFSAYVRRPPTRGEIVALQAPAGIDAERCGARRHPESPCSRPVEDYSWERLIKRVVAGPGDRVAFNRGGRILLGDRPQSEPYIRPCPGSCALPRAIEVPPGHYFVAGDNRRNSTDSRYWGPVPLEAIDGRVLIPGQT